jgi:hypothetical protein
MMKAIDDAVTDKHSVSCHYCGKTVTDLNKTRSAIREGLKSEGWHVAMSIAGMQSPTVDKRQFYREHPQLRGKTMDACPDCMNKEIDRALAEGSEQLRAKNPEMFTSFERVLKELEVGIRQRPVILGMRIHAALISVSVGLKSVDRTLERHVKDPVPKSYGTLAEELEKHGIAETGILVGSGYPFIEEGRRLIAAIRSRGGKIDYALKRHVPMEVDKAWPDLACEIITNGQAPEPVLWIFPDAPDQAEIEATVDWMEPNTGNNIRHNAIVGLNRMGAVRIYTPPLNTQFTEYLGLDPHFQRFGFACVYRSPEGKEYLYLKASWYEIPVVKTGNRYGYTEV